MWPIESYISKSNGIENIGLLTIMEDTETGEVQHSLSSPEPINPYNLMERTAKKKARIWAVTMLLVVVGIVAACAAGTIQRDNAHNLDLTKPQVVQSDQLELRGKRKMYEGGSVQYRSRGLASSARYNQRNNVNRMVKEKAHRRVNDGQEKEKFNLALVFMP